MNVTQQELFTAFESLPTEAQRQVLNLIALLHQAYRKPMPDITTQHQELTLDDVISSIPHNFTYSDDVMDFVESEPLGLELL